MRSILLSELQAENSPLIDILMTDTSVHETKRQALHNLANRWHSLILVISENQNSPTTLSHDVFKTLERTFKDKFEQQSKHILLVWTDMLDDVYPHVWDELKQVYNVEFLKVLL